MVMVLYWTAEKIGANFCSLCTVCMAKVLWLKSEDIKLIGSALPPSIDTLLPPPGSVEDGPST